MVTGSYLVFPGSWRLALGSPPSRHCVTSVVRLRALHLLSPATYWLSTFTLNLKFRYGSKRCVLTMNLGIWLLSAYAADLCRVSRLLADRQDHELRWPQRREPNADGHDARIHLGLGVGLTVTLDEERLRRRLTLEGAAAEQIQHEGPDIQPQAGPQVFVVGFEHRPLDAVVEALLDENRETPDGDVAVFRIGSGGEGAGTPEHDSGRLKKAEAVHANRVQRVLFGIGQLFGETGGAS